MPQYTCKLELFVDASSPEQAAIQFEVMFQDPDAHYGVRISDGTAETFIDLEELQDLEPED